MSETSPKLRAELDGIPTYKPGRPAAADGPLAFKLSSNENPYPPLPGVMESRPGRGRELQPLPGHGLHRADERAGRPVRRARLASRHRHRLGRAWRSSCSRPRRARATRSSTPGAPSRRTRSSPRSAGATSVQVPLTDGEVHDLDAMADAITDRTRMIFVCNPNNPTGTVVRRAELERFLDRVPARCAGGAGRGVQGVHPRRRGAGRHRDLPRPARTWRCCVRSPRRTVWPACGSASRWRTSRWRPRCARRRCPSGSVSSRRTRRSPRCAPRTNCWAGSARWSASASGCTRRWSSQGWTVPETQANFVWLRLGDRTLDFAGGLRAGRCRGPAVRGRGRAGHDR